MSWDTFSPSVGIKPWHLDFSPHCIIGIVHVKDREETNDGEVHNHVSGQG